MIYHFLLLSDENDFFRREIQINSDASFLDLNNFILQAVGYDKSELSTFYLCDEDWNKGQEITLMDMGMSTSEYDSYIMEDTVLEDLLDDKKGQYLLFVFDMLSERGFFMELLNILPAKHLDAPIVVKADGNAPKQTSTLEFAETRTVGGANVASLDFDDNLFGDEELDLNDLDPDGFGELSDADLDSLY